MIIFPIIQTCCISGKLRTVHLPRKEKKNFLRSKSVLFAMQIICNKFKLQTLYFFVV